MSIRHPLAAVAALFLVVPIAWQLRNERPGAAAVAGEVAVADVERGRYLVTVLGCNDCHTPMRMGAQGPEPDLARMLSGHPAELAMPRPPALPPGPWLWLGSATNTAFGGPWGVSYASNLTPDEQTGLGIWTAELFSKTLRSGLHWGVARPIQPPMPWQAYRHLTDADLAAIWAYLRTVPPVRNPVPAYRSPDDLAAE